MGIFWQDLRYGFRTLRKAPVFTCMAVLVVMLGIGANTAIFSVVNAVLLQQLPFKDPQKLVAITMMQSDRLNMPLSIADFEDLQSQNRSFDGMSAYAFWSANVSGQGEPERLQEVRVSANYFQLMGTSAWLGRTLLPEDDNAGSAQVVVLGYGLWRRRFGGDMAVVGKTLELNGDVYSVVGVLPPSFIFPIRAAEMAVPLKPQSDPRASDRSDRFLNAAGRLAAGVSPSQAAAELTTIGQHLRQLYPVNNAKFSGVRLVPLYEVIVGKFRTALLMLLGAVGLLWLIACSSLTNLLLARASGRQREIAIRTALGASPRRLVRQLVTESMILFVAGGMTGILMAAWGVHLLVALGPSDLPRASTIGIDARVLWFGVGLSLLAGLIFGALPAMQSVRSSFDSLRGSGALAGDGGKRGSFRGFIVSAQVALSLVLLVGAGLLLKSFARIQSVAPGFDASDVLALRVSLPQSHFASNESIAAFSTELQRRVGTLPGVSSSSAVSILPLSGPSADVDFTVVGQPPPPADHVPSARYRAASPGYIRTMGIPLLAGREFTESDTAQSSKVGLINRFFARQFFAGKDPIGEHLHIENSGDVEIVGVIGDVKQASLDEEPEADFYAPYAQAAPFALTYFRNNLFWVVRTTGNPLGLAAAVHHEISSLQPEIAFSRTSAMEDYLAASAAPRRFNVLLVGMFGMTALLLAVVGVYGVISYSVERRTREFGLRFALGATRSNVLGVVMGQAGRLVGAGMVVGVIGAACCARLLQELLFQVQPSDTSTFIAVVGLVASVALAACLVPALRAAKVDPMVALRND